MSDPAPPARARRRRRRVAGALIWLLIVVVGLAIGTGWRLTRGPIALPDWAVARVEQRLSRGMAGQAVSLGQVALAYDLEEHALRLRLRNARLTQNMAEETIDIARLPEAQVALDGMAMLRGRLRPRQVAVDGLAVDVSRDAEGRLSLAFGSGGGALPSNWEEALETLDAALAAPIIAELAEVDVTGVEVSFRDEVTGLAQRVSDGALEWRREGDAARLSLAFALPFAGRDAAARVTLSRNGGRGGGGAQARLAVEGVSVAGLAEALPNVPALSLVRGEIGATAAMTLSENGAPGPLIGRLELRDGAMTDRPALALDRAVVAFDWVPGADRIGLTEIAASADDVQAEASGQVLLEEGPTGPIVVQLRLGPTVLDPEGMFDRRVAFDEGVIEARITQDDLGLRIGQAMLTGPSGTVRLSGRLSYPPEGIAGTLRLAVPRMDLDQLVALWPPDLLPRSRDWFTTNILEGTAVDATGLARLRPGEEPEVLASFGIERARFRYMRDMPPANDVSGFAQLDDNRLTLRVDRGTVPAQGPDGTGAGEIDVAGTVFVIPDAAARPAEGELDLAARGEIGDMLTLLDNPPFRLLERLDRTRDLARGQADARVSVRLPLRPDNAPVDIVWEVDARLIRAVSDEIVPGRLLAGRDLRLSGSPELVEIAGDLTLEGVPFTGRWAQPLPPPATVPLDPDAPPEPAIAPPPGRVTGVARVDPEGLSRLGVALDAFELSGATEASIEVELARGSPPRLRIESDLRGLSVALPAISWTKPRAAAATLGVEAILSDTPEIPSVTLDARGLDAAGRVTLRSGGGLATARFDRVETGWFRGAVVLEGRGTGVAPAISIRGGEADLRQALLRGEGGGGGDSAPLSVALDRLTITEGIALTDLRATLRDGSGEFTGRLNGGTPVAGVIAPDGAGTAVQVRGDDAGGVLRSAGLFEDAHGGRLILTLRPTGQTGVYRGGVRIAELSVRNAPALASLLQALSVVGILEQLTGEGLFFQTVESDFFLRPDDILVREASAVGPSMSITADGVYDIGTKRLDMQGVISPIYLVNGLFGALFGQRNEGLFGFTYRLTGPASDPSVAVNPLSILTPGAFREIFRRPPPA
ncbi:putative protein involved in outer membrane biogenesis [Jannaschia seosinensis]|uniref:YhdP central domain-containing protein n=1 Tax=Jannaschia seosinensis TaxID=313367 RepID=A0A0M7BF87_9RHOB|nr:AsmA-like C-terminal region-containing protein [Jannaschia seosinensis]CUH40035.1 putative protein involved in outer membrane biogenesis [Jannaschia seosinensis]